MGRYTDEEKKQMISMCPCLGNDLSFELTSDYNPLYNCIGFAMGMTDVCVALGHPQQLPWCWWPPTAHRDLNPRSLIEAFEYFGFVDCQFNGKVEDGYDKVALYEKNGYWTHAAIVEEDNLYHSKMGIWWDIVHRGGDLFHNEAYGDIFTFMKRAKSDQRLTNERKPRIGFVKVQKSAYAIMEHEGKRYGFAQIG